MTFECVHIGKFYRITIAKNRRNSVLFFVFLSFDETLFTFFLAFFWCVRDFGGKICDSEMTMRARMATRAQPAGGGMHFVGAKRDARVWIVFVDAGNV